MRLQGREVVKAWPLTRSEYDKEHFEMVLDALIDTLEDGVIVLDKDFNIIAFNKAAEQITGYSAKEVLQRVCRDVCQGDRCGVACPMVSSLHLGLPVRDVEMKLKTKDGKVRTVKATTTVLKNRAGQVIGGVEVFRDITRLRELERRLQERTRFGGLIGRSKAMQQIYRLIEDISDSNATVLIYGETGTGKELVANAIHENSPRRSKPFIKVNCAAIPDALLEAELFGYVRGAFTDAVQDKPGKFELADGGSIFLDEIGTLSMALQAKLLRVLQQREFERLGGVRTIKVDVRVIAATNRDLQDAIKRGGFREDLFYRLNVIPIHLPPLRERPEDIPLLVEHFMGKLREETGREIERVSEEAMALLMGYDFPGNIRELENAMEYAFVVCKGKVLEPQHLPQTLRATAARMGVGEGSSPAEAAEDAEREKLIQLLEEHRWDTTSCAKALGMHRTTLWRKMKKLGIQRPKGNRVVR